MRAIRHPIIYIYKHCKYVATIMSIVHPAGSWLLSRILFILFVLLLIFAAVPSLYSGFKNVGDLAAVVSAGFAVCMFLQVIQERLNNQNSMTNELLKDDSNTREDVKEAEYSLNILKKYVTDVDSKNKTFRELYTEERFSSIRKYTFHYEYMGQLIYRRQVNFSVLFDTVTFPKILEDLWTEYDKDKRSNNPAEYGLIAKAREEIKDEWTGIEYLYRIYMLKRAFNKLNADKYNLNPNDTLDDDRLDYKIRKNEFRNLYLQMPL